MNPVDNQPLVLKDLLFTMGKLIDTDFKTQEA